MLAAVNPLALAASGQHRSLLARRSAAPVRKAPAALRCAASGSGGTAQDTLALPARLARSAAAAAAAALLLVGPMAMPPHASAELTTVTPQQATEMAKPLKKQKVNKNRIWGLFVLGATALFGSTVVLENNSAWFPAISRANRAMKEAREQAERREWEVAEEQALFEERLASVQQERAADVALDAAVLEGMLEARKRSGSLAAAPAVPEGGPEAPDAATEAPAAATAEAPAAAATEASPAAAIEAPDAAAETPAVEASEAPAAAAEAPAAAAEAPLSTLEAPAAAAAATAAAAVMTDAAAAIEAEIAAAQSAVPAAAEQSDSGANGSSGADSSSGAPAGEGVEVRKPLFEISGAQIEASSVDRLQQLQQEVERRRAAAVEASSVDRLQQLQQEVERRKAAAAAAAGTQTDQ